MTYCIYGLRVVGDKECRYVGQTRQALSRRFGEHVTLSKLPWHEAGSFGYWLANNRVEAFVIAEAETLAEAREGERAAVATVLALNHRLFNFCLVPPQRRIHHVAVAA